jgi:hypothetical protein
MWRLLALAVPGFDPAQHVSAPVWEEYQDIFDFCHAHILYFGLQAKRGLYYDKRTRSSTFLRAIQQTDYVEVGTTLQTHIESYQDMDAGYLPPNLCMMELANRIDKNAKAWVSQYGLPRANRMYGAADGWDNEDSASLLRLIMYADAPTGDPTPVEFVDSARVPSVSFQCAKVMDDPLVPHPVVKLTSVTPNTSLGTVVFDPAAIPPPCDTPPILPPAEPPPLEFSADIVQDGDREQPHCFPVGSMVDDTAMARLHSPSMPFEFLFDPTVNQYFASVLAELPDIPSTMDSVTRVVGTPRVCGLNGDT